MGANAIISTEPWPEVVQIAKIANKTRIPILSLATSQPLTAISKPHWFRLTSSASGYIQCLAELVKLYNWRQLIVLYEDDDYGSSSASFIPLLNNALRALGSEICRHVAFPPLDLINDPKALVYQELEMLKTQLCTVYIIVRWSSPSLAIDLFKEAETLGMMAKGHVGIAGDDITTLLDTTSTPSISSYMQGVIGIKTYFNESRKSYLDFSAKFHQRFQKEYNIIGEPGIYAVQAYDAVHVILQAHSKQPLLEGIKSTDLVGLSGHVRFRRDGDLGEGKGSSVFRVINVVGMSYKEMGFWSKGVGFYKDKREMGRGGSVADSLAPVYWPGGLENVPGGWRKLKIGVPTMSHLLMKIERDENGEVNVTGFCIDVFQKARELLNYELSYYFVPFSRTYDELVASVHRGFDAVVGDVTILSRHLENVSFTHPFLPSGLSRLVQLKPDRTPYMFTKPFTKAVWFLIAATIIYNSFCIWHLEHRRNPEFDGPWWNQFGAALWLIFSSIIFVNGSLKSYFTKAVVVWFFVVLILTSSFTASRSSILSSQKFEPVLRDGTFVCDNDSFSVNYLHESLGYEKEKIVKIDHIENYTEFFERGIVESAYLETKSLRVFLADHDGYTVYGETHNLGGLGFVFLKGSPLADDFLHAILLLSEMGALKELENKWFSLSFSSCPSPDMNRDSDRLGQESFWGLFLGMGVASTIVLLSFKARLFPSYGRRTSKGMKSWRSKYFRSTKMHQLSRRNSKSSKRIAPEPAGDHPLEFSELHHCVHADIEHCQTKTTFRWYNVFEELDGTMLFSM